jgi:hypothetical protein
VCLEKADGKKYRREYAVLGNIVRFAGEHPCELPPPVWSPKPAGTAAAAAVPESTPTQESLGKRLKDKVTRWFRKSPQTAP